MNESVANETVSAPAAGQQRPVAPAWHTIVFLVLVVALAGISAHSQAQVVARHGRVAMYVATMAWEWLLTGYILWGARRRGVRLREIVAGKWNSPEDALIDIAIAIGFWLLAAGVLAGMSYALGLTRAAQLEQAKQQLGKLLPHSRLEMGLWIGLSATAGFCEEIMFRGYLMKQFAAATGSASVALVLQAIVFGIGHAYQGTRRIVLIGVYGLLFGALALWRRSLRPGMFAHAMQDSFSGLVFRFMK